MLKTTENFFRATVILEDEKNEKFDLIIANRCETEESAWTALDRFLGIMKMGNDFGIVDFWVEAVTIMRKEVALD